MKDCEVNTENNETKHLLKYLAIFYFLLNAVRQKSPHKSKRIWLILPQTFYSRLVINKNKGLLFLNKTE